MISHLTESLKFFLIQLWVYSLFFCILSLTACGNSICFAQYSENSLDSLCGQIETIFIKTSKYMLLAYSFLKKKGKKKMELGWITNIKSNKFRHFKISLRVEEFNHEIGREGLDMLVVV